MKKTNAKRLRDLLNRNGLTDSAGQFYAEANAFNVVSLILKNVKLAPGKAPVAPLLDVELHKRALSAAIYITGEMVAETAHGLLLSSDDSLVGEIESAAFAVANLQADPEFVFPEGKDFNSCCDQMAVTVSTKKPLPNYGKKLKAYLKRHD